MSADRDNNITDEPVSLQHELDAQDAISSDYECEVEPSTRKRRKPKAKFQRLSKARQLANARERRRAQRIQDGFANLARHVPQEPSEENRLSRMEILQRAIDYIRHLEGLLGLEHKDPPPALKGSESYLQPSASPSVCQSPAASIVVVQTPTASTPTEIDSVRAHPAVTKAAFTINSDSSNATAEGKVPMCTNLDLASIDFDIDEDLSDIPASPEDIYDDLESIISSSNERGSSPSDIREPHPCPGMGPCGHAFPPQFTRQFGSLQPQTPSYESMFPTAGVLPPYTTAISTPSSSYVGLATSGAEKSPMSPRIPHTSASSKLPYLSAKRQQNGVSLQSLSKRVRTVASPGSQNRVPPPYGLCNIAIDYQTAVIQPTFAFGNDFFSGLQPNACSV